MASHSWPIWLPYRCVIVLISDGRANVPLNISTGAEPTPAPGATAVKLTDAEKKDQRTALKEEVLGVARQIGSMSNFKMLVIDTENKFVSTGKNSIDMIDDNAHEIDWLIDSLFVGMAKEIAQAANGKYHYIPKASADAMKRVTVDAVASLKNQK